MCEDIGKLNNVRSRGLSRGKIGSIDGSFTKCFVSKADPSQNVLSQKQTFHKMFCLKNGPFTKCFVSKTDHSQNVSSQKRTLHKILPIKNGLHKIFPVKNGLVMDLSMQNPNICKTNKPNK